MKHTFTFLLICLGLSVFAQRGAYSGVQLGASIGGGLTVISPENNYGGSLHAYKAPFFGYTGGINAAFMWYDTYGFQIELNYAKEGQSFIGEFNRGSGDKLVTLDFIQIPIMYRHVFPTNGFNSTSPIFYILGGVQADVLAGADVTYKLDGVEEDFLTAISAGNRYIDEIEAPAKDADLFRTVTFSASVGLGFEFPLENDMMLTVEGRTNIGLSDINSFDYRVPHRDLGYLSSSHFSTMLKVGVIYFLRPF